MQDNKHCDLLYEKALDCWCKYSLSHDTLLLRKSEQYLDSIDCKPVKYGVFELKVSLIYLLKDYERGKDYIASFDSLDFGVGYKKNMYLKTFEALTFASQGDTIKQNQLYLEIVKDIQNYLSNNPNEESLYDLYTIKRRIESRDSIIKEIEHIRFSKLYNDDFLDALIETITANDDENWY